MAGLIVEFILSLEVATLQLQWAFQNGDRAEVGNIAHQLKSLFSYLGVTGSESSLREREALCRTGKEHPQIERSVGEVIRCGIETLTEVRLLMHHLFPT